MRKIKVAFFSDVLRRGFDGANRTMFHIIDRIPQDRYEFFFIYGDGDDDFQENSASLRIPNIGIPFNRNYKLALPTVVSAKLRRKLDRFRPDVIHIASPSILGNFAVDYARPRGIPTIAIYHTHYISYVPYYTSKVPMITSLAQKSVISGQRIFYNKCDTVLVPTNHMKEELIRYGFHEERLKVWPRGLDHKLFYPSPKLGENGSGAFKILFASRLVWEKNLKTLINIYKRIISLPDEIEFMIVGDGPAYRELRHAMPQAHFIGKLNQSDLAGYYRQADLFLFPSISETYGSVLLEAMACGCPCLVARGGGTAEYVKHEINGMVVSPEAVDDYVISIIDLKNNSVKRQKLIDGGIKFTQSLSWDELVSVYLEIIDNYARSYTWV